MMASFASLHNDYDDDDDDDDDDEEEEIGRPDEEEEAPPANPVVPTAEEEEEDDDEEEEGDSESGDGDLPLATPYPWQQDDYELTLHHEPKKRKPVGTGMVYAKRFLLDSDSHHEEATILSDPAKIILKQLLREHTKKSWTAVEEEESSDDDEESDDEEEDDDEDEEAARRKRLPGPRLWTAELSSTGSLFPAILEEVENTHPLNVTTRQIIRTCALKIPPGAPPGAMDAKEYICSALFLLTCDWKSPDPSQLPSLPLIRSTAAPGNARDLEKRTFEKVGDWTVDELPLGELERLFFESPSSGSQLQWISRIRFCPRTKGASSSSESNILLKGTIPARFTGKKPTTAGGSPGPKKAKVTQGIVMRGAEQQGKQFPFHPFGGGGGSNSGDD